MKKVRHFFWGVSINKAVKWEEAANRELFAYGISFRQWFFGIMVSRKCNKKGN